MKKTASDLENLKHGGVKSLLSKAIALGIKVKIFTDDSGLVKLEYKDRKIFIKRGAVPVSKRMGNLTTDKNLTKACLNEIGVSVPRGFVADSSKEALLQVKKMKLKYPLILKPVNGTLARGVVWDIKNSKELEKHILKFKILEKKYKYKYFLVEEMSMGSEYRILVFNGKVISCVEKIPASIQGDGKSSVEELIHKFNEGRRKGFEIKIDSTVLKNLRMKKISLKSVIAKGDTLKLRNNLNMSDGGRSVEFTSKMSKFFKKICEKAVDAVGLTYGGVDLITEDITNSKSTYVILEINPNPFYNMHEKPLVEGKGIDFSLIVLKSLFSNLK